MAARQFVAVAEGTDSTVLEEASDDRLDRMLSERPGTPGRRQQMPRTTANTFTPARDASYSLSISLSSTRLFILSQMLAGLPARAKAISLSISATSVSRSDKGL